MSERSTYPPSADRPPPIQIRPLSYPDLPQVIAVERRVFPTPWSLAMFVLELSKQSGVCLAAFDSDRLVAYMICSRYDTVWHIMNIAVDLDHQRQGLATALLRELDDRVARHRRATRWRCGARTAWRSISTSAKAFAPPGCAGATTRTTARTRS